MEIPTADQVAAVADWIGDRLRALVVVLAGSGLRIGDARGREVEDADFLRRTVRAAQRRSQAGIKVSVKSKTSRRKVPVGQIVIDELAVHLAKYPTTGAIHR